MAINIVNLTLEFTARVEDGSDMDLTSEAMLRGAVESTTRDVTGIGYSFSYTKKRSRRGLTINKEDGDKK